VRNTYARAPVTTRGNSLGVLARWGDRHASEGRVEGTELLTGLVARDRLYFFGSATSFPETFTIDLQMLGGLPALKTIHGRTGEGFDSEVTYNYRDISFPASLPDWYFAPATYGAHVADAPES